MASVSQSTSAAADSRPPRYWLITMPRSCSHLLVKILNLDEQGVRPSYYGGYFFYGSAHVKWPILEKPSRDWEADEVTALQSAQQKCFDNLQDHIAASDAEGQSVFVKEHAVLLSDPYYEAALKHDGSYDVGPDEAKPLTMHGPSAGQSRSGSNRTALPDEFLRIWKPTFLIRHPARAFPSHARSLMQVLTPAKDDGGSKPASVPSDITMLWNRKLYEFFDEHFSRTPDDEGKWPIVLDADDVLRYPDLVRRYASRVGLDPEKLRFEWETTNTEEMSAAEKHMLNSLNNSTGVNMEKLAGDVDIEAEAVMWRQEFGEEGGRVMEKCVRGAMPDYEFLKSRRMMP